jgi:D-alanine-D-alanine ligase
MILRYGANLGRMEFSERTDVNSLLPCLSALRAWRCCRIPEILFEGLKATAIYGYDAKWTPDSAAYISTERRFGLERDEPELSDTLKQLALDSWTLFGFSGYARIDFRVDPTGAPFIIDVNPNPYLIADTEDVAAAGEAGLYYQDLIGSIVESALRVSHTSARYASQLRMA